MLTTSLCGSGKYAGDCTMSISILNHYFNHALENYYLVKVNVICARANLKLMVYGKMSTR